MWETGADSHVVLGYAVTCLFLMGPFSGAVQTIPVLARADVSCARIDQLGGPVLCEWGGESHEEDSRRANRTSNNNGCRMHHDATEKARRPSSCV